MFVLQIKREIGSSKLLKHPNVVRLYEVRIFFLCIFSLHCFEILGIKNIQKVSFLNVNFVRYINVRYIAIIKDIKSMDYMHIYLPFFYCENLYLIKKYNLRGL